MFPDAQYYWLLARTICQGAPYEVVEWGDIAHKALRVPGYPLFLAICQSVFGENPLAVRIVQAALGAASVWLVYRLTLRVGAGPDCSSRKGHACQSSAMVAAALAAFNPYYVLASELILSEALFMPLMLLTLLGLAAIWRPGGNGEESRTDRVEPRWVGLKAVGVGIAGGAATLTRPSWALFLPLILFGWVVDSVVSRRRRKETFQAAGLVALGVVIVMGPWWVRNSRIFGRFVPTAIWLGASLYDGLNPGATGASEMSFLGDPEFKRLREVEQDQALTRRAVEFARSEPRRVLELAVVKLGRYWSPWPNCREFQSLWLCAASAVLVVPLYLLMAMGAWELPGAADDYLAGGAVAVFFAVHLVFVSSIRYRIPAEIAAMGLAGFGLEAVVARVRETAKG